MASVINTLIPQQNFELIRDRIGVILFEEFASQYILSTSNPDLNPTIYNERIIPVSHTETPLINVMFSGGNSLSQNAVDADYSYTYFIDVYTSSPTVTTSNGDKLSLYKLHRLLGMVRAILSDARYKTLGFTAPSIERRFVSGIQVAQPENKQDGTSSVFGRVTFEVRVSEITELKTPNPIDGANTIVTMNETELGYLYSFNS